MKTENTERWGRRIESFVAFWLFLLGLFRSIELFHHWEYDWNRIDGFSEEGKKIGYMLVQVKSVLTYIGYIFAAVLLSFHKKAGWILGIILLAASSISSVLLFVFFSQKEWAPGLIALRVLPIVLGLCLLLPVVYTRYGVRPKTIMIYILGSTLLFADQLVVYLIK